jgi:hypothetical protein
MMPKKLSRLLKNISKAFRVAGISEKELLDSGDKIREDLFTLKYKNLSKSIKKARNEIKNGEVFSHNKVFGK